MCADQDGLLAIGDVCMCVCVASWWLKVVCYAVINVLCGFSVCCMCQWCCLLIVCSKSAMWDFRWVDRMWVWRVLSVTLLSVLCYASLGLFESCNTGLPNVLPGYNCTFYVTCWNFTTSLPLPYILFHPSLILSSAPFPHNLLSSSFSLLSSFKPNILVSL